MKKKITISLSEKALKSVDAIVDRIFLRNRSQAIEYLIEKKIGENKVAVILATGPAGALRISKEEYRPTARIANSSVAEMAIENLRENGFKKIYIIGEQPVLTAIFDIVGDGNKFGVKISYLEDRDPPGTAASLRLLKGELKSTFLVVFGDILFSRVDVEKLWKYHFRHHGISTLLVTGSSTTRGGTKVPIKSSILEVEGDKIIKFLTKPTKPYGPRDSGLVFSCLFVAEPEMFSYSGNWLENDIFPYLAEKGYLYSYMSSEGQIHIHSKEDKKLYNKSPLAI